MTAISFEFFPPKSSDAKKNLIETAQNLSKHDPGYFSVTFGAGGSTQSHTPQTVKALQQITKIPTAPHISCIGSTPHHIKAMLDDYKENAINSLVALRGDMPSGSGNDAGEFKYASELIHFIRESTNDYFDIHVAAYPECHPETQHPQKDLLNFKKKVDAGASSAITQYFYNADAYEQFLCNCAKLNIDIPIIPGIMPITNFIQLNRFSRMCGAEIPQWIRLQLESYGDDLESIKAFGADIVTRLCERLLKLGAPGLHFYTLNKEKPTTEILKRLDLRVPETLH